MTAFLEMLTVAGLVVGALLTVLGFLAARHPLFDVVNQGRMLALIGSLAVLALALLVGNGTLIAASALIAIANATLFAQGLPGAADSAPQGTPRFLRLVTFNVWKRNTRLDDEVALLDATDADLVVLQEVTAKLRGRLRKLTKPRYPYLIGDIGIVILSKIPVLASGQVDGANADGLARKPVLLWTRFDVEGFAFELIGVHPAFPFRPRDQVADTDALIQFVRSREGPLLVAGDFNLTPWSWGLRRFTRETGLKRFNTLRPTWPVRRLIRLVPLVPIDHVFASCAFKRLRVKIGSSAGSDHLPVVADIALAAHRP